MKKLNIILINSLLIKSIWQKLFRTIGPNMEADKLIKLLCLLYCAKYGGINSTLERLSTNPIYLQKKQNKSKELDLDTFTPLKI